MIKPLLRLQKYEHKIFSLLKKAGKLGELRQLGFSRKDKHGFKFPIYQLTFGKKSAVKNRSILLVAGVHGLETVAVNILLDYLNQALRDGPVLSALKSGKLAIVAIPILNPGGLARQSRSNPGGVDLMRNSGVEGENALFFFGGQKLSGRLPYYQGKKLEPESILLFRALRDLYDAERKTPLIALDVHSGYGNKNYIWWPYAKTRTPSPDDMLFRRITGYMEKTKLHNAYHYGPQSEMYTTHGDLWDLFYDHFLKFRELKKRAPPFLPFTLEIGTWTHFKKNPTRILKKREIFNPPRNLKKQFVTGHREFLHDFSLLGIRNVNEI
ncbi:MAG: DUF2817 domain-containing protein [Leptospiraceae bacterium]|nr:DUF2817 domain-containing protein [Leptospiraceae bacterium]